MDSTVTIDHTQIRDWAEARGAAPAATKGLGNTLGALKIDLNGNADLKRLSWDEWFEEFDNRRLAFVANENEVQLVERHKVKDQLTA